MDLLECREGLRIAEAAFRSDAAYMYAPPVIPPDVTSRLVLGPEALDVSGGDGLKADLDLFDKQPNADASNRSTYVQKDAQSGYRLSVHETNMGWRGDTYAVFAMPETMTLQEATNRITPGVERSKALRTVGGWRPPLVFADASSRSLWFIYVGEPYVPLSTWSIYAMNDQGLTSRCSVEFMPLATNDPLSLLPPAVRALDGLLRRALGSGRDEGTLHPTARIAVEVQHTWGNVALRPWALGEPYNTRGQVDAGLVEWADGNSQNKRLLQEIRREYKLAERALAGYYQRTFRRPSAEAATAATYALDISFRAHFVFHDGRSVVEREQEPPPNPWRATH